MLKFSNKYFSSKIYYSYKANYLPAICKIVGSEGLGAEIATKFEYDLAIQNGIKPESIILSSPYKTTSLLVESIANQIGLIFLSQIDEITEVAKYLNDGQVQKVGIRLRSQRPNKQLGIYINKKKLIKIVNKLQKCGDLTLTTLQLHSGTQLDSQMFKDGINYLLDVANQFEQQGFTISQLDFGGGFPEAGNLSETDLDDLFLLLSETLHDRGWQKATCIFEPGRYIVGDAGLMLTQIVQVFEVDNIPWIMLNTGTHHCPKLSNSKFRFEIIDRMSAPHSTSISIAGCLPTDMDVFTKRCPFIDGAKRGDSLAIFNAGAYTLSWSTRFSYPFPPMLLINKNQITKLELPSMKSENSQEL